MHMYSRQRIGVNGRGNGAWGKGPCSRLGWLIDVPRSTKSAAAAVVFDVERSLNGGSMDTGHRERDRIGYRMSGGRIRRACGSRRPGNRHCSVRGGLCR